MLKSGEILEVTGLSVAVLKKWLEESDLKPRLGRGKHHEFTTMEAFGLAVGFTFHTGGCPSASHAVVKFLAAIPEEELVREFERGNVFLVPRTNGRMQLTKMPDESLRGSIFDIEDTYREFKKRLNTAALRKTPQTRPGRRRGTISAN